MFNKEPTVILGALSEAVRQIVPALIVFGFVNWTGEKTAAFNIICGVFIGFLNVLLTRSQVSSEATVNALISTATHQRPDTSPEVVKDIQAAKDARE